MLEDGRNTRKPPWLSRSLSVVVNRPDALAPCRYKDSRLGVSAAYDFLAKDSAGVAQTLAFPDAVSTSEVPQPGPVASPEIATGWSMVGPSSYRESSPSFPTTCVSHVS